VKNKALARQYHTFFNWDARNANSFFGLFGGDFKDFMTAKVEDDSTLEAGIKAFLQLGDSRNELVHENFATFALDKTAEEIYELYKKALRFVEVFPMTLSEFCLK
jgi:RiboL-PSP-HEPN